MSRRRNLDFRPRASEVKAAQYKNVSVLTGTLVSEGVATLNELDEVYSYEDALDLYEIIQVKYENRARANEHHEKKAKQNRRR